MLGKLYTVRKDQEKADKALNDVREQVKGKEDMIKSKEDAKSKLNERITDQKAMHEVQFEKLRIQLDLQSQKLLG
jgi:predicted  nucleic acid-binding Zn-ribbon protein